VVCSITLFLFVFVLLCFDLVTRNCYCIPICIADALDLIKYYDVYSYDVLVLWQILVLVVNFLTSKMPKVRTLSAHSRASSYSSSSMTMEQYKVEEQLGSAADVKEWVEARCPICMEHPHNAVLLKCSSYEKGCRPYMCNTSYRHSNCLDQFCKSFAPHASIALLQENPLTSSAFHSREDGSEPGQARYCGSQLQPKLFCPLCRGEVYGYSIVEPARKFMNSKARSCSSEMCNFSGTYSELRKHARSEHPSIRPADVDPMRQRDWTRLERERELEDVLSSLHPEVGEESSEENTLSVDFSDWVTSIFDFMFCSLGFSLMVGLSDVPSDIEQSHYRRARGEYDMEVSPITGRNNNLSSESMPRLRQTTRGTHGNTGTATIPSNLSSMRVPHHRQVSGWSSEGTSPHHRQMSGWSSEGNSRSWSSQNRSSFSSYGRPRFRQMPGQSTGSGVGVGVEVHVVSHDILNSYQKICHPILDDCIGGVKGGHHTITSADCSTLFQRYFANKAGLPYRVRFPL
jgi:hypothetical protein